MDTSLQCILSAKRSRSRGFVEVEVLQLTEQLFILKYVDDFVKVKILILIEYLPVEQHLVNQFLRMNQ